MSGTDTPLELSPVGSPSPTASRALVAIEQSELEVLGLNSSDLQEITELAARIDPLHPSSVSDFGAKVGELTSAYADELLTEVRNADFDDMGSRLTEVVAVAQKTNMSVLGSERSSVPVIGRWIDRMRLKAVDFQGRFDTSKEQIDKLVINVEHTQGRLLKRNDTLEMMFANVKDEYRLLGMHVAAGRVTSRNIREEIARRQARVETALEQQEVADLHATANNLEIRVANLLALQQSALQTLPQIRAIQATNRVLVDKFDTIKTVTIPAWKRQFVLALGLNETKNAAELAQSIDNFTNEMLNRGAELLHKNAVATAKSNQRLVIDVETLQNVQNMLIKTVQDVSKITADGSRQRETAARQIEGMRNDLRLKMSEPIRQKAP